MSIFTYWPEVWFGIGIGVISFILFLISEILKKKNIKKFFEKLSDSIVEFFY